MYGQLFYIAHQPVARLAMTNNTLDSMQSLIPAPITAKPNNTPTQVQESTMDLRSNCKTKTERLARTLFCSTYLLVAVAGQNTYGCYLNGITVNMVPVDISCKAFQLLVSFCKLLISMGAHHSSSQCDHVLYTDYYYRRMLLGYRIHV
jgi:hypothetical protein